MLASVQGCGARPCDMKVKEMVLEKIDPVSETCPTPKKRTLSEKVSSLRKRLSQVAERVNLNGALPYAPVIELLVRLVARQTNRPETTGEPCFLS